MADDDNDDAGDNSDDDNDNDGTRYAGHTQSQIVRNQTEANISHAWVETGDCVALMAMVMATMMRMVPMVMIYGGCLAHVLAHHRLKLIDHPPSIVRQSKTA